MDMQATSINKVRTENERDFGEVSLAKKSALKEWNLQEKTSKEVHKNTTPLQFLEDDDYTAYMRNPFSDDSKRTIKIISWCTIQCETKYSGKRTFFSAASVMAS